MAPTKLTLSYSQAKAKAKPMVEAYKAGGLPEKLVIKREETTKMQLAAQKKNKASDEMDKAMKEAASSQQVSEALSYVAAYASTRARCKGQLAVAAIAEDKNAMVRRPLKPSNHPGTTRALGRRVGRGLVVGSVGRGRTFLPSLFRIGAHDTPICRAQADYYEQSVRIEAISNAKENDKSLANQRDAFVAEHEAKEQLLAQQPGVLAKANALAGRGE